jgi:putative DNA primase/helicase
LTTPYAGGGEPSPEQIDILASRGIPITAAERAGVRFVQTGGAIPEGCPESWAEWLPAIFFPWRTPAGHIEWQIRPDTPAVLKNGEIVKYATRSREFGFEQPLWLARQGTHDGPRLLVEGTCQTLAAATWAPDGVTVVGMIGCRGWSSDGLPLPDLAMFEGTDTYVALDADMYTNPDVWDAGEALQTALYAEGASVKFVRVPGSKKSGLDDALGKRPEHQRTSYLDKLIANAEREKFPKSRRPKAKADPDSFFGDGGLRVEKLAVDIFKAHPSALTREGEIALYQATGVYEPQGRAFIAAVAERLGDDFRPSHRAAVEEFTVGTLHRTGRVLPEHVREPLLNVANGMLDLPTATLKPHDPIYMSSVQFPIEWNPDATCPTYEQWIEACGIADQIDDLEEIVSLMLDPSRTPTKAVFLFGPSRSGKGTFLRIMEAIAGIENVSGVRLSQLCEDRFAAANVYGKALNVSGDLSAGHIEDISLFKQLTGDDLISADRKFGQQFVFRNTALFAFAANELPTVGEASRAYVERIRPFKFAKSFAGHEDPTIEQHMIERELPGILVRWVHAWQRLAERGAYRPTNAAIRREFEMRSDRVRQWLEEEMVVTLFGVDDDEPRQYTPAELPAILAAGSSCTPSEGAELPANAVSTPTELTRMFASWANDNSGRAMGRNKLVERLTSVNGVMRVRRAGTGVRGLNLTRRAGGDPWDGGEPPEPAVPAVLKAVTNLPGNEEKEGSEVLFPVYGTVGGKLPELPATPRPPLPRFDDNGTQALDALLALGPIARPPTPDECPECDGPLSLVPGPESFGHGFWYACRACNPGTFDRS